MADPNSLLTWARFRVARWIEPMPDPGEAWCMNCMMNGGRTLVVAVNNHRDHSVVHADAIRNHGMSDHTVAIRVNWGTVVPPP